MNRALFRMQLLVLLVVIAAVNGIANVYSLYWRFPWFDIPMHYAGGFWLGGFALWLLVRNMSDQDALKRSGRLIWIPLAAVLVIGGLGWELFEFGVDTLVAVSTQNTLRDTVGDIFFDMLGSVSASWYVFSRLKAGAMPSAVVQWRTRGDLSKHA